jgi:hypothetical protein
MHPAVRANQWSIWSVAMIERMEPQGILVRECTLPGESKAEEVWPAHPNGLQVSKDRWLIVYATRGFRFMDDDRSIVYQLRAKRPDGPVIKEGWLSRSFDGWDPVGDGKRYFKQHGHPVVFGVPKGALIGGKRVAHENVFAAKWRIVGIYDNGPMDDSQFTKEERRRFTGILWVSHKHNRRFSWGKGVGQAVEWCQFRLNDREDDIEFIQPARKLQQRGCEDGPGPCAPTDGQTVSRMNQSFVQAAAFNSEASEWADVCHFDGARIGALKYRFNTESRLYEWVETGPLAGTEERGMYEASLARVGDSWVIAGRPHRNGHRQRGAEWFRTDDPFKRLPSPTFTVTPDADTPITAFTGADGVLRLFANDERNRLPNRGGRNPLYAWDVNPDTWELTGQRVVFDTFTFGLPIRPECDPGVDMCKLLPHSGGREQLLVYRVRTRALTIPYLEGVVTPQEVVHLGVYHTRITYTEDYPPRWQFA